MRALGVSMVLGLSLFGCEPAVHTGSGSAPPTSAVEASAAPIASASASALPSATPVSVAPCTLERKPLDDWRWSPDGAFLLTAGTGRGEAGEKPIQDGSVDAWDLRRGERVFTFDLGMPKADARPLVIGFAPDGKTAYSAGWADGIGQRLVAWDLVKGTTRATELGVAFPAELLVSKDGQLLVMVGVAAQVLSVELPSLKKLGETAYSEGHSDAGIDFDAEEKVLLHRIEGGGVTLRDPRTLKAKKTVDGKRVSPDGKLIAVYTKKGSSLVLAASGKQHVKLEGVAFQEDADPIMSSVAFSPDGSRVALQKSVDHKLYLHDTATGKLLATAQTKDDAFNVSFSPDGKVLLAGGQVFEADTLKPGVALAEPPTFSFAGGHALLDVKGDAYVEIDAMTGKPTGKRWDLPGYTTGAVRSEGGFITYAPEGSGRIRIVRLSDNAWVELGVVRRGEDQLGFALGSDGAFDGAAETKPCSGAAPGLALKDQRGLLTSFLAKR